MLIDMHTRKHHSLSYRARFIYDYHSGLPTLLEKNYSIDRASLLDDISGYPYGSEVIVKERDDYISNELLNTLSSQRTLS